MKHHLTAGNFSYAFLENIALRSETMHCYL